MAKFSDNAIKRTFGFDVPCIAAELVYNQKKFWNFNLAQSGVPVSLVGATIDAQIIRRQISNLTDTRYGLDFSIADYSPTPSPITLTISNRVDAQGSFTIALDDSTWSILSTDTQLDISATNCVAFSGRIKISFPANGNTPAQDVIMFVLFLIRSDGIVN